MYFWQRMSTCVCVCAVVSKCVCVGSWRLNIGQYMVVVPEALCV